MFGRKVFFLNPPLSVENYVVDSLKEEEYEVYVLDDYKCAKPILRLNPNSICFIFIDDGFPLNEWYNYIKSFEYDETLKTIFLGVISLKIKPAIQQKFLMNLKLPGGCVLLDQKVDKIYELLEGILKINGAKGCRKYVRLDCNDDRYEKLKMDGYLANGGMLYSFSVANISSAGFACVTPAYMNYLFPKLTVINNVSITVGRRSVVCNAFVYDSKIVKDKCLSVLLFTNETPKAVKMHIRNFIYEQLENAMKNDISSVIKDMESYSDKEMELTLKKLQGEDAVYTTLDKLPAAEAGAVLNPAALAQKSAAEAEDIEAAEPLEDIEASENKNVSPAENIPAGTSDAPSDTGVENKTENNAEASVTEKPEEPTAEAGVK